MTPNTRTAQLHALGQSLWLDNITRALLASGTLQRYIDGFTKFRVPDRSTEHIIVEANGARQISDYSGAPKCTNPLFAAELPDSSADKDKICNLRRGTRSPDLVFFAVVGGVPNELLYPDGYDPNNPEKNRTTNDRWVTILGKDPGNFNYDGINAHMIQSVAPRKGLTGADLPRGNNGDDSDDGCAAQAAAWRAR